MRTIERPARQLPPYGGPLVARGVALVATDYQGLGTPGEPTTYDGIAEGHAILDSIRAIKHLPGVEKLGSVLIAGNPQGGGQHCGRPSLPAPRPANWTFEACSPSRPPRSSRPS